MTTRPGLEEALYPTAWPEFPLRIFTLTGAKPGPTLALIGAVHGDELEGPLVLSRLMREIDPNTISGRLILCPAANPEALAANVRCSPSDGLNLARAFPGGPDRQPTEVLADLITRHVIHPADALIDLHSAGVPLDCPVFAGYGDDARTLDQNRRLAAAFGAPVIWRHPAPLAAGRTLSVAEQAVIPAIYVEAGGGLMPPDAVLGLYEAGVRRVMCSLGMLEDAPPATGNPLMVGGDGDLDHAVMAPVTGLCHARVGLLGAVEPGQACFDITDLDGRVLRTVSARTGGTVIFLRRSRWVQQGDLMLATARPDL